jgi:uncharacterized protein (DUF2062 family)/SAM-dependent methyltransferase
VLLAPLRNRLHALAREIARAHLSPVRVALAVAVGCVVGCTPLFGLHLLVCMGLAWLLGLNQVIVYAAANVSLPPLVPFIGFACIQAGERVLHHRFLRLTLDELRARPRSELAKIFFVDWMTGALFVGGALGLVAGAVAFRIARRRVHAATAADAPPRDPALEVAVEVALGRAAKRYRALPRKYRFYARFKYRLDPCYRAIAPHVPPGARTVDLGTGLAMLPVLLGELGEGRSAVGVEWDTEKAACGRLAAAGLPIEVVEGDARVYALPACDVITLVDMLHYYDEGAQRTLLGRCAAALRPGGHLLVREGDRARSGGAWLTRAIERLVTRLGWNRGPQVRFRPVAELRRDLEALGFEVEVDEVAGRLHPGNVLFVAAKAAAPAAHG